MMEATSTGNDHAIATLHNPSHVASPERLAHNGEGKSVTEGGGLIGTEKLHNEQVSCNTAWYTPIPS